MDSPVLEPEFSATGARPSWSWSASFSAWPQTPRASVAWRGLYFRVRTQIWCAESDPPEQTGIVEIG